MNHGRLDDEDYPAVTMGQAAELLDVQPAFLRSLDAGGVLHPARSGGGHRRYSRRQLRRAARLRALFDEGHTLAAAHRIATLEDELSTSDDRLRAATEDLEQRTDERDTARADLERRTDERDTAQADLDRRTDELAVARRALETAHDRIAELDRALHDRPPGAAGPGPAEVPDIPPAP